MSRQSPLSHADIRASVFPSLRTFVVSRRKLTDTQSGATYLTDHGVVEETVLCHTITLDASGALVCVELTPLDDDHVQHQYRYVFAPGYWFSVVEKVMPTVSPAHVQ